MKSKKTIWGSVGLLVGVVVGILAFVRGSWLLPLLIAAFAVWGLWLLWTQVLPFRRTMQLRKQKAQAGNLNRALAQTLLHHVNYRVSAYLAGHENSKTTMDIYAKIKYNKPEDLLGAVNAAFQQGTSS